MYFDSCSCSYYDCLSFLHVYHIVLLIAVAPICYAHLAAAQMAQFIKFEEILDKNPSDDITSAGAVPVQELPRLENRVKNSMFFC